MTLLARTKKMTAGAVAARLESLQLGPFTMATTVAQTLDSLLCDSYAAAEWRPTLSKDDGTVVQFIIEAHHNGTASADATTAECSISRSGKLASGDTFTLDVDLSGAGVAQVMRLRLTVTHAAGTYKASVWRVPQKPPQYT